MQKWIIGLIVVAVFIYLVKEWFDYKKVAVETKSYPQTLALLYLFLGFMAFMGISSLSSEVTAYLFSLVGMTTPEHFEWEAMAAYIVFAVASVAADTVDTNKSIGENIHDVSLKIGKNIKKEIPNFRDLKNTHKGFKKFAKDLGIKNKTGQNIAAYGAEFAIAGVSIFKIIPFLQLDD